MWNAVLGGAVAVTIATSSIIYAQQPESEGERGPRPDASQADRTDSTNARSSNLASLKERLRLTPDQEKNWAAFESAFRALTQSRRSQEEARPLDPVPQMRQRAEALAAMGAALSRLADAEAPLYNSLNEDQRRQFATFAPVPSGEMQGRSLERELNRDDRGWRDRDEGDRRGWRSREEDDRRRWRDREDDDRFGWRGRDDDRDRRSWRGRDYDEDRRGWRGRDHDDERHSWRGRDDDDRRSWRGWDDDDRRSWRDWDDDEDRRSRRGRNYDDRD